MYIPDLNFFSDPDQYPDLLNIHPKHPSSPKVGQPLNPAALVMPPTPPAQFPHQFQVPKGQLISECLFDILYIPKTQQKV